MPRKNNASGLAWRRLRRSLDDAQELFRLPLALCLIDLLGIGEHDRVSREYMKGR